jgi:hypothetical protein
VYVNGEVYFEVVRITQKGKAFKWSLDFTRVAVPIGHMKTCGNPVDKRKAAAGECACPDFSAGKGPHGRSDTVVFQQKARTCFT